MSIDYSKPNLFKYRKRKKDFSDKEVRKIFGYMQDPKVQSYIKGLDDKGMVSFVDSLKKMQTDKSFTPDILKKQNKTTVPELQYTVPKSMIDSNVLDLIEKESGPQAGNIIKINKPNLDRLLVLQQQAQGGGALAFDDDTDTFSYKDQEDLDNLIATVEEDIEDTGQAHEEDIKAILKINPQYADKLQELLSVVKDAPKEEKEASIRKQLTKFLSFVKNAWNKNVENTNKMVKSPPPNLQKD
tara:strand:- start:31 stop:756 length:726 start_codon:yes stop_codon:yes gene_type:complete